MRKRTREEATEYQQKWRAAKVLSKYITRRTKCYHCDNLVSTLHHINENQADNTERNLLPLCQNCHLNIKHIVMENPEMVQDFQKGFSFRGSATIHFKASSVPVDGVLHKESESGDKDGCYRKVYKVKSGHVHKAFNILKREDNLDKFLLMPKAKELAREGVSLK